MRILSEAVIIKAEPMINEALERNGGGPDAKTAGEAKPKSEATADAKTRKTKATAAEKPKSAANAKKPKPEATAETTAEGEPDTEDYGRDGEMARLREEQRVREAAQQATQDSAQTDQAQPTHADAPQSTQAAPPAECAAPASPLAQPAGLGTGAREDHEAAGVAANEHPSRLTRMLDRVRRLFRRKVAVPPVATAPRSASASPGTAAPPPSAAAPADAPPTTESSAPDDRVSRLEAQLRALESRLEELARTAPEDLVAQVDARVALAFEPRMLQIASLIDQTIQAVVEQHLPGIVANQVEQRMAAIEACVEERLAAIEARDTSLDDERLARVKARLQAEHDDLVAKLIRHLTQIGGHITSHRQVLDELGATQKTHGQVINEVAYAVEELQRREPVPTTPPHRATTHRATTHRTHLLTSHSPPPHERVWAPHACVICEEDDEYEEEEEEEEEEVFTFVPDDVERRL
jgi:hypothetical protein